MCSLFEFEGSIYLEKNEHIFSTQYFGSLPNEYHNCDSRCPSSDRREKEIKTYSEIKIKMTTEKI